MTDTKGSERPGRGPGTDRLMQELGSYVEARLEKALTGVGGRMGDAASKLGAARISPGKLVGKKMLSSTASHLAESTSHAKDALVDKVKSAAGKDGHTSGSAATGGQKSLTVIEDIDVGVPVRDAYNQWTQFQEFDRFAKGVVEVEQQDDTTTQWQVKIGKSSRAWTGRITEQIPDERIAWTSEGAKGTTKGVVTFHPLGENLTKVLLVMEYFPHGIVEKAGALVRAQGRRARLDLKAFRTFVMMRGEATGGWRGEIHDGEVVSRDEPESEPESTEDSDEDETEPEGAYEDEDAEDDEEEPEDRYEDEEEAEDEDEDEDEEDDEYEDVEEDDEAEDDEEDEDEESEGPAQTDEGPRNRRSRRR
ncbi:SRPBCC family protein [Streptomyces tritici]|uniref:SRPBCC family protein n=1 Tax=Streptomyces tritici TaxID=2054410 RepID=UPI003AF115C9